MHKPANSEMQSVLNTQVKALPKAIIDMESKHEKKKQSQQLQKFIILLKNQYNFAIA